MKEKTIPINKKNEIVEITKKLVDEQGVNNVSIRDIVKKVGMAQGLFYYYFKSKDEILNIIINEYSELFCYEIKKDIDSIQINCISWKEKIKTAIILLIRAYKNNTSALEKFNNKKNKDLYMSMVYSSVEKMAGIIENLINQAVNEGFIELKYPKETTYILIYGIIDLINQKKVIDENIFVDIVLKTLNI